MWRADRFSFKRSHTTPHAIILITKCVGQTRCPYRTASADSSNGINIPISVSVAFFFYCIKKVGIGVPTFRQFPIYLAILGQPITPVASKYLQYREQKNIFSCGSGAGSSFATISRTACSQSRPSFAIAGS